MRQIRSTLLAVALGWPLSAAAADEEIRFKKGEASGTVHGQVSAFNKTYTFRARQGQHLTATLTPEGGDRGMLTLSLSKYCGEEYGAPLADDVLQWQGQLPCSDRYSIDVRPSEAARKAARVQRYSLTLTIR